MLTTTLVLFFQGKTSAHGLPMQQWAHVLAYEILRPFFPVLTDTTIALPKRARLPHALVITSPPRNV